MLLAANRKALLWGAFLFLLSAPLLARCLPPSSPSAKTVFIDAVYDGDTVRLQDGRKVRLIGVNTPEMNYRKGRPEPGAIAAKKFLSAYQGQPLLMVAGSQKKDRYGRTLAHLYLTSGESLEELILHNGLGYFVSIPPNINLSHCLQVAERVARAKRRGIWKNPLWPKETLSLKEGISGFAILRGRISKISRAKKAIYLELDDRVALKVPAHVVQQLSERHSPALMGRRVEVRGWLRERRQHPAVKAGKFRPWIMSVPHVSLLEFI